MGDNEGAPMGGNISAAMGGASGIVGAALQAKMARSNMREQMAFQRDMSNTAFQRQTQDLEKAGLNRILGYASGAPSGGGASSPAGSMAGVPDMAGAMGGAVQSAQAAKAWFQEQKNLRAREGVDKTQSQVNTSQKMINFERAETERQLQGMHSAAAKSHTAQALRSNWESTIMSKGLPHAQRQADFWAGRGGRIKFSADQYLETGQRGMSLINMILGRRDAGHSAFSYEDPTFILK